MGKSKIEWTDRVWNPVTGCTKVSAGCANCYAERDFHRPYPGRPFSDVQLHPDRLEEPLHLQNPQRIFVCSMGDLFHGDVPDEFIDRVFAVMALCPHLTFQVLTKRPKRMIIWNRGVSKVMRRDFVNHHLMEKMDGFPRGRGFPRTAPDWPFANVWLGVSVEDQETANERIPILLQTPAAMRFVSIEPMLGPVDLRSYLRSWRVEKTCCGYDDGVDSFATAEEAHVFRDSYTQGVGVNPHGYGGGEYEAGHKRTGIIKVNRTIGWIICGGESGSRARPMHPDWARSLRDQCQSAGVPFFFKQWGEWEPIGRIDHGEPNENLQRICQAREDRVIAVNLDGSTAWEGRDGKVVYEKDKPWAMERTGKKAAGRLLDDREWNEFPKLKAES